MISVIIPTYNSEDTVERTVESLLDQNWEGDYEIIAVDSSTDRTPEILSDYPVKVIRTEPEGPGKARNLGAENADGEILAFTDADCEVDENWLSALKEKIEESGAEAVGGKCITPEDTSLLQRLIGYDMDYRFERIEEGEVSRLPTMNLAVEKSVFEELGGFNPDLITSEDVDFGHCLWERGYKMVYTKDAVVYHHHRTSLKDYAEQKFNSGSYIPISYFENPTTLKGDQINPSLMVLQPLLFGLTVLSMIGWFFSPFFYLLTLGLVSVLGLTFVYRTFKVYDHFKKVEVLLVFFLYLYWVFFISLGLLNGLKNLLKYKLRGR